MLELAQKEAVFSGEQKGFCSLIALPGGFFHDLDQTMLSAPFFWFQNSPFVLNIKVGQFYLLVNSSLEHNIS